MTHRLHSDLLESPQQQPANSSQFRAWGYCPPAHGGTASHELASGGSPGALPARESQSAQTLRRGLSILKLLARSGSGGVRISDIARRLGLTKGTALRLAQTLEEEQFVIHDARSRCYRLGPEAVAVGVAAEEDYSLQRLAAPVLRTLAIESGHWACFSVVQGFEVICTSIEVGDAVLPAQITRVGDRYPLGVSAAGLAVLAALPDEEVERALAINGERIEQRFPASPGRVVRRLVAEARETGYALVPGILLDGYWALGVPVLQADGRPVAAVSLVARATKLHPVRCAVLGERMVRLARSLAGDSAPSR